MTKQSVHFNETMLCEYHSGAVMDFILGGNGVEAADIWYQQNELQQLKRKAMILSKETNKYGLGSILSNTYGRTDDETQQAMNIWSRSSSSRRGLERFINNEYSSKRSDVRRRTIKSVIRAQRKMKEEGVADDEYSAKVLSRLSEAFSQDSRNFARMMGVADAVATEEEQQVAVATEVKSDDSLEPSCCNVSDDDETESLNKVFMQALETCERSQSRQRVPNTGNGQHVRPFASITTITNQSNNSSVLKQPPRRNLGLNSVGSGNPRSVHDLRHYC